MVLAGKKNTMNLCSLTSGHQMAIGQIFRTPLSQPFVSFPCCAPRSLPTERCTEMAEREAAAPPGASVGPSGQSSAAVSPMLSIWLQTSSGPIWNLSHKWLTCPEFSWAGGLTSGGRGGGIISGNGFPEFQRKALEQGPYLSCLPNTVPGTYQKFAKCNLE